MSGTFCVLILVCLNVHLVLGLLDENENTFCDNCFYANKTSTTCLVQNCNCTHVLRNSHDFQNLEKPSIACIDETIISFTWKVDESFIYFIEVFQDQKLKKLTNATRCGFALINRLSPNTTYSFRLVAVSFNKTVAKAPYVSVKTHEHNRKPLPVSDFQVDSLKLSSFNNYEAVLSWKPTTNDFSCAYNLVWFDRDKQDIYSEDLSILNAKYANYKFRKEFLTFGNNYSVSIMATTLDGQSESEKKTLSILIPSCLESNFTIDYCVPEKPKNLTVTEHLIDAKHSRYDVKLKWAKPKVLPTFYIMKLVNFTSTSVNGSFLNISGDKTEGIFENVQLSVHYQVFLSAGSKAGTSPPISQHRLVNITQAHFASTQPSWKYSLIYTSTGLLILILVIVSITFYQNFNRKSTKNNLEQSCKYIKNVDNDVERPNFISNGGYCTDFKKPDLYSDEWEIDEKFIIVDSMLGEGAFGMVRHGWYCPGENSEKIPVAIKMLKDMPTSDEFRQFQQEIEIMKSVPQHPNLVKFFGCITKQIPTRQMLVVEYCANGDLQTYLRTAYENLNNQFKQIEFDANNKQEFSNILYDIQYSDISQFYIQPKDLISFARQVVLGMIHLSKCKVLHRDLAARNVLICADRTVKISDFGLSRDVYCDSVYCKTGNGKLPIRWMALESLTHQRYTTQSDVWSFGILLWEIVTLGATPYPGVETKDLLVLLKKGYRMEKPENCSNELYAIMNSCWKTLPKERPSFMELYDSLDSLLEGECDYLTLSSIVGSDHVVGSDYDNNKA